jgi:hypothetical protein
MVLLIRLRPFMGYMMSRPTDWKPHRHPNLQNQCR